MSDDFDDRPMVHKDEPLAKEYYRRRWNGVNLRLGCWAPVGDGEWVRPNKQQKLDPAMTGQLFYCPNCGTEHPASTQGHIKCTKCSAQYWISLGYNPSTGDVAVVKIERWK